MSLSFLRLSNPGFLSVFVMCCRHCARSGRSLALPISVLVTASSYPRSQTDFFLSRILLRQYLTTGRDERKGNVTRVSKNCSPGLKKRCCNMSRCRHPCKMCSAQGNYIKLSFYFNLPHHRWNSGQEQEPS